MRLGIDFGTTRIVAAAADRGNFPLISFESGETSAEWFPALIAVRGNERRYGWEAWQAQYEPGWTLIRSLKRFLEDAGPNTSIDTGEALVPLTELTVGLAHAIKQGIVAQVGAKERLEVMLGVPANANSNQRFLTTDAFRGAGFDVLGLLNEPSAASIEFGHRKAAAGEATRVLVYDLGGGTFDASLVHSKGNSHTVIATSGLSTLGGDDFDRVLAQLAIGDRIGTLEPAALFRLEDECRRQKEALHPNSRRVVIDLDLVEEGLGAVTIPVADFYEACRPLLEQTVEATAQLADRHELDVLYVTGGGSELPIVARMLREVFGRKVKRSEYTRSATAIGLAIQASATSEYTLHEVFTRNFGVWREADAGHTVRFDTIFPVGTRLPAPGSPPLTVTRDYAPAHNIGHFRYLESSTLTDAGEPSGDIAVWDEVLFPLDPALSGETALAAVPVTRKVDSAQHIEERYACDATGAATVTIRNLTAGYEREFRLGRWNEKTRVVKPSAAKGRSRQAST